jgi:DNA-binding transcriptional regulator YiaG
MAISRRGKKDKSGGGVPGKRNHRGDSNKDQTVTCLDCGASLKQEFRSVPFDSLPTVTIKNMPVWVCSKCDYFETILFPERVHRVVAKVLAKAPRALTGDQIRYLRKLFNLSASEFAKELSVDPSTLSRWENGIQPMGKTAEKLVRAWALAGEVPEQVPFSRTVKSDRSLIVDFADAA